MNQKGFIATSVLYSLIAILAVVVFIVIGNYSTILQTNREDAESLKEQIYDGDADIILAWEYEGTGRKPTNFPKKGEGYKVTDVECNGGSGSFNPYTWKAEIEMTGKKARCVLTITDGNYEDVDFATSADIIKDKVCIGRDGNLIVGTAETYQEVYDKGYQKGELTWKTIHLLSENPGELKATSSLSCDDVWSCCNSKKTSVYTTEVYEINGHNQINIEYTLSGGAGYVVLYEEDGTEITTVTLSTSTTSLFTTFETDADRVYASFYGNAGCAKPKDTMETRTVKLNVSKIYIVHI